MQRLMLDVQGIQRQELAGELGFLEQFGYGGDLALVLGQSYGSVDPLARLVDGVGQRESPGTTQVFAVDRDQVLLRWAQSLVLPVQQESLYAVGIQGGQGALIRAFGRHDPAARIVGISPAARGPALRLGQAPGEHGNLPLAHQHPAQLGQRDDPRVRVPGMPAALGMARIADVVRLLVQERDQLAGRDAAPLPRPWRCLFKGRQRRGATPPRAAREIHCPPVLAPTVA